MQRTIVTTRWRLAKRRGWKARYQEVHTARWSTWVAYPGHDNDVNTETLGMLSFKRSARRFGNGLQKFGETVREAVRPLSEFAKAYNDHPASVGKRNRDEGFTSVQEYADRVNAKFGHSEQDAGGVVTIDRLPGNVLPLPGVEAYVVPVDEFHPDFEDLPEVRNIPKPEPDVIKFNELTVPQLREHARDYSQAMSVQLPKGFAKFRRAQMIQWMTDNMEGA
jgi:hypothetical protein